MALYNFTSNVLSAASVGTPPPTHTVLSATGVNTISLSSVFDGLAFNALTNTSLVSSLCALTVLGSVFRIDRAYHNSVFALMTSDRTYTVFTYQSSFATVPVSAFALSGVPTKEVTTPESLRLRLLGYI
jgi:hypothetical protein